VTCATHFFKIIYLQFGIHGFGVAERQRIADGQRFFTNVIFLCSHVFLIIYIYTEFDYGAMRNTDGPYATECFSVFKVIDPTDQNIFQPICKCVKKYILKS
jgi:hypothetical protein